MGFLGIEDIVVLEIIVIGWDVFCVGVIEVGFEMEGVCKFCM